jgi:hypothetical protein
LAADAQLAVLRFDPLTLHATGPGQLFFQPGQLHLQPANLLVQLGGPQPLAMAGGQTKHRQALGDVLFHPGRQFGRRLLVLADDPLQLLGGSRLVGRIEHAVQVVQHFALQLLPRHMGQGILHQVELTPLPGHAAEARLPRFLEARMGIAD